MIGLVRKILKKVITLMGFEIIIKKSGPQITNGMASAIARCQDRGIHINSVIDVGASNGIWTKACMNYYPDAFYYLVEAQKEHEPSLAEIKEKHSNLDYIISAAGNRQGMIYFDASSLDGGLASETYLNDAVCVQVPVTTIDHIVEVNKLKSPYLMKLDTHGFEIPILEGAAASLNYCNIVIIECYNFQLTKDSLKFYEICKYMEERGFSPIDIIDLTSRPKDHSMWQMDIFFVRSDRVEFTYNRFF